MDGWRLRLRLRFGGGSIELSHRESPLYGLAGFLADRRWTSKLPGVRVVCSQFLCFTIHHQPPHHHHHHLLSTPANPQSWHTKAESVRASAAEVSLPIPHPTKTAESVCASSPSKLSTSTKTLTCTLSPTHPLTQPPTNTRLQLQEPCRLLRMPSLSHRPPKRRLLPRPHARPQAPNQPRPSRRSRSQRRPQSRPHNRSPPGHDWTAAHRAAKKSHQDRPARVQNNKAPRPRDATTRAAVSAAVSGDWHRDKAALPVHERV